jgi:hypothetical protein
VKRVISEIIWSARGLPPLFFEGACSRPLSTRPKRKAKPMQSMEPASHRIPPKTGASLHLGLGVSKKNGKAAAFLATRRLCPLDRNDLRNRLSLFTCHGRFHEHRGKVFLGVQHFALLYGDLGTGSNLLLRCKQPDFVRTSDAMKVMHRHPFP